jgi:hypothetical protein
MNLSSRKDYIETDYVNGVYDKTGNPVIRKLTFKEKEFLNKFYEETVVTNFFHHPELKLLNQKKRQIIEDGTVMELKSELNSLEKNKTANKQKIKDLKEIIRITKKQNEETFSEELYDIEKELQELREEKLLYSDREDHKVFYNENNSRNNCLFNKKRITGKLFDLDIEEYDAFISRNYENLDAEYLPEEEIDSSLEERAERILKEVVDYFKGQKS